MRKAILAALVVLGLVSGICLSGMAGASQTYTVSVIPKVTVESGGSLSIAGGTVNGNQIDFENVAPGSTTLRTLTLGVNANDSWTLKVGKTRDLTDDIISKTIPSANFTYTSNGPAGPTYVTTDTQFGTDATPSNVVTNGSAVSGCNVNVVYKLVVPAGQPKGYYTAPSHTYTLIVGSP